MGDKYADADDGDRQIEMWKIKRVRADAGAHAGRSQQTVKHMLDYASLWNKASMLPCV